LHQTDAYYKYGKHIFLKAKNKSFFKVKSKSFFKVKKAHRFTIKAFSQKHHPAARNSFRNHPDFSRFRTASYSWPEILHYTGIFRTTHGRSPD